MAQRDSVLSNPANLATDDVESTQNFPATFPPLPPATDPSPEDTYALLAQELNKLSIKERDTIYADIHGVAEHNDEETEEMRRNSLMEMELAIENISRKSAYLQAKSQSAAHVEDPNLRLKFLRAHCYNISDAARAFVSFFESKKELFGVQKLSKNIELDDLVLNL